MKDTHGDPEKEVGVVTVANVGRRPIYVSHVALILPSYFSWNYMVLPEGISGMRLAEGDAPRRFLIEHDEIAKKLAEEREIQKCPHVWKKVRAEVSDSAGKQYYS